MRFLSAHNDTVDEKWEGLGDVNPEGQITNSKSDTLVTDGERGDRNLGAIAA